MRRPLLALLCGLFVTTGAAAQTWPTRPIRAIVPFPAGGVTDVGSRLVAQKLGEALGQPVVIENRPGASGTLGVDSVIKSTPDGYTILMTTGDFTTVPSLMPKTAYDPFKDVIPVTRFATVPLLLLTNPGSGLSSVQDLIAKAKAEPGKYAYASPGLGTINQLAAEWFALEAGIKLLHVPYKGGAQITTDLTSGIVPLAATTQATVQGPLDAGRIKALALLGRERPSFMRDMPTMTDAKLNVDASLNVGLYVPLNTPPAIIARLDAEVLRILKDEALRKRFNELGMEISPVSGPALAERIRGEAAQYTRIIEQTGVKLN